MDVATPLHSVLKANAVKNSQAGTNAMDDAKEGICESVLKTHSEGNVATLDPKAGGAAARRVSILSSKTSESSGSVAGGKPLLRRRSSLRNIAQSVTMMLGMRRRSLFQRRESKPVPKLENTFKMEPDDGVAFSSQRVKAAIDDVFSVHLKDTAYEPKSSKDLACRLSDMIQHRVKMLGFERHKLICSIVLGQRLNQGVEMASRCLWDPKTDSWACVSYQNDSLFAVATVHGIYYD